MLRRISAISLIALLVFQGCEYAHEPAPPFSCDAAKPTTYNADVKPIINANCVSGCHEPAGSYNSLPLTTATEVKFAVQSRNLLKTINHAAGFSAMPQNQPKLIQTDIDKITCWADNGFKD